MRKTKAFLNLITLSIALGACGCNTFKSLVNPDAADVDVPYKGDIAAIKCTASASQNCINGIGHLLNKDWQKAVDELAEAVAKDNKDHKAQFALGVAYEMLGNLDNAMEHYKAANFVKSESDYMRAVDRVETKLKQKAGQ